MTQISLGWPWWLGVILGARASPPCSRRFVGWLSVRTEGIYTIMITLAIGMAFFYLAQQNYTLFNGFQGFHQVLPPQVFGIDWREPVPFYFLALGCALAGYFFVKHLVRAPFGIALQGMRDNPRRMRALGFNVTAHRVAALCRRRASWPRSAACCMVWYNGRISPGTIGIGAMINILVIAVLGGMRHPIGAFIGAIVFVLLQNFAIDLVEPRALQPGDRRRCSSLIVLFSPDGLLGLWDRLRRWNAGARESRR